MSRRPDTPLTGIVTRYQWHEATYAALRVADFIEQHGASVSVFPINSERSVLDSPWQSRLISGQRFTDWAAELDQFVFTHVPTELQVAWLQDRQKRVVCLPVWHELDAAGLAILMRADLVLAASPAMADWLRQLGLQAVSAPWDVGLPLTSKVASTRPLRILWPLYDGAVNRVSATACHILRRALQQQPDLSLTVLTSAATLSGRARRMLRQLQRDCGPAPGRDTGGDEVQQTVPASRRDSDDGGSSRVRMTCVAGTTLLDRQLAYMRHDLTFWPTVAESFGLVGLTSATLGTPVLTYAVPPLRDLLPPTAGWQVPLQIRYSEARIPYGIQGDRAMDTALQVLVSQPEMVREKQRGVLQGLGERRTNFEETLGRALFLR